MAIRLFNPKTMPSLSRHQYEWTESLDIMDTKFCKFEAQFLIMIVLGTLPKQL